MIREKGRAEHGVYGNFGRTAHVGSQKNGHLSVPVGRQGPGCHNGRNRAAEAHQHGDKGPAGQADFPQELIHHKSHPGHIAGVFQHRQEEEQNHNQRQEAEDASHTGKNTTRA